MARQLVLPDLPAEAVGSDNGEDARHPDQRYRNAGIGWLRFDPAEVRRLPAANGGKLPAIALTAYTRTEDRLQALRAGYDMHVPKPVELGLSLSRCAASVARNS